VNEIKVFRITAIHTQWLYCTRVSIHILLYIILCAIEVVYDNNIDNNNVTIYTTPMFIIRLGGGGGSHYHCRHRVGRPVVGHKLLGQHLRSVMYTTVTRDDDTDNNRCTNYHLHILRGSGRLRLRKLRWAE